MTFFSTTFHFQERCVAKVVPDRIFSLAVHPTESKHLIAAGGKWGGVGLWDVDDVHSDSHGVNLFMVSDVHCCNEREVAIEE